MRSRASAGVPTWSTPCTAHVPTPTTGRPPFSAIATGLGELRNGLVVRTVDAVVAVGGGHGTLSEIALALKAGKRVVGLGSWEIAGMEQAASPAGAVAAALA